MPQSTGPAPRIVLRHGFLIDGTGRPPIDDASVVVDAGRISEVGATPEVGTPDGATVYDLEGKTIMPGLIDSHLHLTGTRSEKIFEEMFVVPEGVHLLRAAQDAQRLLEAGYTTVKDCGSVHALHIRRAIDEGTLRGARIVAGGYIISQTFGHGDAHFLPWAHVDARRSGRGAALLCDGVDECLQTARFSLREGADFIKICSSGGVLSERDRPIQTNFTLDELRAFVQVARNAGTFVTTHCQSTEGMRLSIEAGVHTIDHAYHPDEDVIASAKRKGVIFVPTLALLRRLCDVGTSGSLPEDVPEWAVRKAREAWDTMVHNIRWIYESGATIAAGTDYAGSPLTRMGTNAKELELLVTYCGVSPMDALLAATRNGAMACGLEGSVGTLEPGKRADLLVVSGNPLQDVRILQEGERMLLVMRDGVLEVNRGLRVSSA